MKQVLFPEDSLIKAIDNWNEMSVDNYLHQKASNPKEPENDNFKIPELPSSHYTGLESGNTMDTLINSNTMNGLLNDLLNGNTSQAKETKEQETTTKPKTPTPSLIKSASTTSIIHEINSNDILNLVESKNVNAAEFKKSLEEEGNSQVKIMKPTSEGYSALLTDFTFSSNQPLNNGNSLFLKDTGVSRLKSTESNPGTSGQELGYDYEYSQQSNQSNRSNRNFAHIFDPQTNITTIKDEKKFNSLLSMGNSQSCPPIPASNNPVNDQKPLVNPSMSSSSPSLRKLSSTPQPPAASSTSASLYQSIVNHVQNGSSSSLSNLQQQDSAKKVENSKEKVGGFGAFSPQTVVTPISDAENESNQSKNAQLLVQQSASNQHLPMNIFANATTDHNTSTSIQITGAAHPSDTINLEREGSNQSHTSITTANLTTPMKQSRKRKINGLQQKRDELLNDFTSDVFERAQSISSTAGHSLNPSMPTEQIPTSSIHSNPLASPPAKQPRKSYPPMNEQQVLTEKIFSGLCHLSPALGINFQKSSSFVQKFSRVGRSRPDLRRITPTYIGPLVPTITSNNPQVTSVTTSSSFMLSK